MQKFGFVSRKHHYWPRINMPIVTDEQFKKFIDDSKWLQKNYNELIKEFNLEFVAIRNHKCGSTPQRNE